MSGSKKEITKSITSDKLHNENCFHYLTNLKVPRALLTLNLLPPEIVAGLQQLQDNSADPEADPVYIKFRTHYVTKDENNENNDENYPYADLYTKLFDWLEENTQTIYYDLRQKLLADAERIKLFQPITSTSPIFPLALKERGILPRIKAINEISPNENFEGRTFKQAMNLRAIELQKEAAALDEFIKSLYANDNHILETTFEHIKDIPLHQTPRSPKIEHSISHYVSDEGKRVNRESNSPAYEGSRQGRFLAMMSNNYKPQHGTSLSTVRHYKYKSDDDPIEYRFGTQGQRHHGEARISPLFELFLDIQDREEEDRLEKIKKERATQQENAGKVPTKVEKDEDRITHVYFNFLGRDRTDPEGLKEKALTEKLEELELHNENGMLHGHKNIAVITLPADKGLMSKDSYARTKKKHNIDDVKEEFLRIAQESPGGRDLRLMDKLPDDLTKYKGSYIYINNSDSKTLFYIKADGKSEEVPVNDFSQFDKKLHDIKDDEATELHLSDEQVKSLVTANGGHTPPALPEIKDFHISERIREKIFRGENGKYSRESEEEILNSLIEKSFKALGYDKKTKLSDAQRQAVWFHFLKYELTNHIISSLQPKSINFTCKDAIDRGGVASAYYNLVKSFEPLTEQQIQAGKVKIPMSRKEFDQALHAAPAMVKGRGMNHHIKLIWNAVDAYVTQNHAQLQADKDKSWLIEWRDFNCPHNRVAKLLKQRIVECRAELEERSNANPDDPWIKEGQAILHKLEHHSAKGVSGKRLLLETVSRTTTIAIHPEARTEENYKCYKELRKNLSIAHPELHVLGGLMKAFAGAILYVLSGKKLDIGMSSGWATFKAGRDISSRESLQSEMHDMKRKLKELVNTPLKSETDGVINEEEKEEEEVLNTDKRENQSAMKRELDGLRKKEEDPFYSPPTSIEI
ncbi:MULTISPECIES: hypothetical protein [Legionella]|uniref:hypothetical protein n=1 Tax=Legionella TaxID=445 RepID=UPI00095C1F8B|nr:MULTISPECIES: hypothetical protein [Legionella]MBN9226373.1 hypothetical protein [Legionella steelei]OJW12111.1 MAG: hypothetical protein BGO44_03510 [Legionella sp. 39-23]